MPLYVVAGHIGADRPRVCPRLRIVILEQVLRGVEVAERFTHCSCLEALAGADALADQAVLDRMAVLVADHGHVEVAVDAGCVERAG